MKWGKERKFPPYGWTSSSSSSPSSHGWNEDVWWRRMMKMMIYDENLLKILFNPKLIEQIYQESSKSPFLSLSRSKKLFWCVWDELALFWGFNLGKIGSKTNWVGSTRLAKYFWCTVRILDITLRSELRFWWSLYQRKEESKSYNFNFQSLSKLWMD